MVDFKDFKEVIVEELDDFIKILEIRIFWVNCEFKDFFDVLFMSIDLVKKFIEDECLFGKFVINIEFDIF